MLSDLETRKMGVLIYFFGTLGVLAHPQGLTPPDMSKIIPISPDVVKMIPVAGMMFFATIYGFLMFVTNCLSEYAYHKITTNKDELDAINSQKSTITPSENIIQQNITGQLISASSANMNRYVVLCTIRNIVEIVLPILFGMGVILITISDGYLVLKFIAKSLRDAVM